MAKQRSELDRVLDPTTFVGALAISLITGVMLRLVFPPPPPTAPNR